MKEQIPKILSKKRSSRSQTWITKQEFEIIIPYFKTLDKEDKKQRSKWKRPYWGQPPILGTSEERLFYVLRYLKTYPSFDTAGAVRWMSKSSAHNQFRRYFPMLRESLRRLGVLPPETPEEFVGKYGKDRNLWDVFVDASERRISRSKKK